MTPAREYADPIADGLVAMIQSRDPYRIMRAKQALRLLAGCLDRGSDTAAVILDLVSAGRASAGDATYGADRVYADWLHGRPTSSMGAGEGNYAGPTSTEVRSPTRTRTATEVRSPTSTSTEVRSPTNTSTEAYTADNFTATVTGGAGAGATTVNIYPIYHNRKPRSSNGEAAFPSHVVPPRNAIRDMLQEIMRTPPPTGVMTEMMHEAMGPSAQ